ncbi:Rha family transcriptional regulator [Providencia sp. JUb39]|uniref:Rha family transcriptional regulator n=1 Tax=Providencia sp. JUb39 TaxID=2724165 RepID=UPI00164D7CB1|nr:Rha family transcriptional regulator [Providencia sp. JUb39]MBC5790620.1 Rha family transcriptional regulator [Providencia sp. JUb39]
MNTTALQTQTTSNLTLAVDNTKPLTMSSREIAEYTGKEHKNVRRDIRNMLIALQLDALSLEHIYKDQYGREQAEYHLDEELTLTLVTGYDVKMRMTIVKEWKRLKEERAIQMHNPFYGYKEKDWIQFALNKVEENKQLIDLHVRKSVDCHSMTRLLGEKKGSFKVRKALMALCDAGYIIKRLDEQGKSCGYDLCESGYMFCRMTHTGQLEFTVDIIPLLVELGVLEQEEKESLRLPSPCNLKAIVNTSTNKIRQNTESLSLIGYDI